jgi:hypothetical protein
MDRILFEEKQKLPGVMTWIALTAGLAACFPVMRGVYLRTVLEEPWGDPSLSNMEAMLLLIFLLACVGLMLWFLTNIYLEVIIDQTGIWYRYFPHHRKRQRIEKNLIASFVIRDLRWYEMARRRSKRLPWPNGDQRFSISGRKVLELTLNGGQKVILGTQDKDRVIWAMGKLTSNQ